MVWTNKHMFRLALLRKYILWTCRQIYWSEKVNTHMNSGRMTWQCYLSFGLKTYLLYGIWSTFLFNKQSTFLWLTTVLPFLPTCFCMFTMQILYKGVSGKTNFPEQKFCFGVHFFFSYKNVASKSFYKS